MELADAVAFARDHRQSVLVTIKGDGRPQLSNVMHTLGDDGVIRVSITATRAKYANLRREPWAALHVSRDDFYAYAVIECSVELSPVAQAPDDASVEELISMYRAMVGEHEDWDDYRRSMVTDQRLAVRLTPQRAYGMLPK
jgi:PPOX class probable F420-dependent enzyme